MNQNYAAYPMQSNSLGIYFFSHDEHYYTQELLPLLLENLKHFCLPMICNNQGCYPACKQGKGGGGRGSKSTKKTHVRSADWKVYPPLLVGPDCAYAATPLLLLEAGVRHLPISAFASAAENASFTTVTFFSFALLSVNKLKVCSQFTDTSLNSILKIPTAYSNSKC